MVGGWSAQSVDDSDVKKYAKLSLPTLEALPGSKGKLKLVEVISVHTQVTLFWLCCDVLLIPQEAVYKIFSSTTLPMCQERFENLKIFEWSKKPLKLVT